MPQQNKTLIMKFGGAATKAPENFARIANLIIEKSKKYSQILIVVSAMGDMTNQLIYLAHQVHPTPPKREYDMLVSVGERISISLLAMALLKEGKEAVSFTGSQSGIITSNQHSEAKIIDVRPYRVLPHLQSQKIVIVAGFQGVSDEKEITTLGRGGSDTSAVAMGVALGAEKVEFYKDVAGIYPEDPKHSTKSTHYPKLGYSEACRIVEHSGGRVLHPRAINLAQKNNLPLHIRSFYSADGEGTLICDEDVSSTKQVYENELSTHFNGV